MAEGKIHVALRYIQVGRLQTLRSRRRCRATIHKRIFGKSYPGQTEEWYKEVFHKVAAAHVNMKEIFRLPETHDNAS